MENKKVCAVCEGFLYLKSAVPQWVGTGSASRVSGVRVTQECFNCDIEVTRRMTVDEFRDYSQVMHALNLRRVLPF